MAKACSTKNLYDKKHSTFDFDGVYLDTMGNPETHGAWLIWGPEKNGKTKAAILLANYLSGFAKTHYISGEEGFDKAFIDSIKWANISPNNHELQFHEYEPVDDLKVRLKKKKGPKVVFFDNVTVYVDELKNGVFRQLLRDFPQVLFIFLAHEERGEPYTATAKLISKLAKIKIHVSGLSCTIGGRCPGGLLNIDDERSALFHGNSILKKIS